jgi:glyoxylase-like metal-dependent hydrolase (beta-lactamase superfamily II)
MYLRQFIDRPSSTLSYLLACSQSKQAVMIDPVLDDLALYLGVLDEMDWQLQYVLETHLHVDHMTAAGALRQATGALVALGDAQVANADRRLVDGDCLEIGLLAVKVIATPGHTPCCLTYHCADRLFTGDCLLIGDCGNLCAQGADAGLLFNSITRKLFCFTDETLLYPGHDQQGRQVSCIGEERRNNPLFNGVSRDEFIARMAARSCPLTESAQKKAAVNRYCGLPFSKSTARSQS